MELIKTNVAVDHKKSSLSQLMKRLKDTGAMRYTFAISTTAPDIRPPSVPQYMAPYSGVLLGYYMVDGKHTLFIFEDTSQTGYWLLLNISFALHPLDFEACPGDVFYQPLKILTEQYE